MPHTHTCPVALLPLYGHATPTMWGNTLTPVWSRACCSWTPMHCTASPASEPSLTHFTLHRSLLIADWLPLFLGALVSLLVTFSPERSLADCTHYLGGCLARGLLFSFLLVVNFAVQCCTTQMSPSRFRGCRIIVPLVLGHPEFPQILTDDISPPSPRATSRVALGEPAEQADLWYSVVGHAGQVA